jgi:hypothetical protein
MAMYVRTGERNMMISKQSVEECSSHQAKIVSMEFLFRPKKARQRMTVHPIAIDEIGSEPVLAIA